MALICCESGKLDGLPLNRALRDSDGDIYDIVAGNFFIVGLGESDFIDLPHELAERFAEQFRQPEMCIRDSAWSRRSKNGKSSTMQKFETA